MLRHNLGIQQFDLRMIRRDVQTTTHHRLAEGGETDTGIEDLLGIRQIAADHGSEDGKAIVYIERHKEIPLGIINIRGAAKCIRHLLLFDTNLFYLFRSEHKFCGIPLLFAQQRRVRKSNAKLRKKSDIAKLLCKKILFFIKNTILNFSVTEIGSFIIEAEKRIDTEDSQITTEEDKNQNTSGTEIADTYTDPYISGTVENGGRRISDGKQKGQDQYKTDPVPEGKPLPVEPENQTVDTKKSYTCTFSIECASVLDNLDDLASEKQDALPVGGIILPKTTVTFYEGESVYDVLQRVCENNGIRIDASWTPLYNSAYVEGIGGLYEFDCGADSGWMYRVNGWYPNYGCSRYQLEQGDVVEWRYTCDLGADIGGGYAVNP